MDDNVDVEYSLRRGTVEELSDECDISQLSVMYCFVLLMYGAMAI